MAIAIGIKLQKLQISKRVCKLNFLELNPILQKVYQMLQLLKKSPYEDKDEKFDAAIIHYWSLFARCRDASDTRRKNSDETSGRGGYVVLCTSDYLQSLQVPTGKNSFLNCEIDNTLMSDSLELLQFTLSKGDFMKPLMLVLIYRPPNTSIDLFSTQLYDFLCNLNYEYPVLGLDPFNQHGIVSKSVVLEKNGMLLPVPCHLVEMYLLSFRNVIATLWLSFVVLLCSSSFESFSHSYIL